MSLNMFIRAASPPRAASGQDDASYNAQDIFKPE
jgi:hypothetical protein